MSYEEDLKKHIPAVHRSPQADEFLEATGEVLDGFQQAVDDLRNAHDFELVDEYRVDLIAQEIGIDFLRSISISRKRQLLREAIDLYRTNGTEKSLQRIFKLIGWEVEIDYCWIIDPNWFAENGSIYELKNSEGATTPVENYQILFGTEVVHGDGIFVDIRDPSKNKFSKRPIYHENYKVKVREPFFVKVPYLKIAVTHEDYQLFVKSSTSSTTNQIYEYGDDEKFQILKDLREYFLEQARPAHVAIYELSSPFALDDKILFTFLESFGVTTINTGAKYDGTLVYGGYNIDRYILGETMGNFQYGQTVMDYYGVKDAAPPQKFTRTYAAGTTGIQLPFLLRKNTQLKVTIPSDVSVVLMASKQNGKKVMSNPNWNHITTLSDVSNYPVDITDFLSATINIVGTSTSPITVEVNYK